jgi:hypothetical protein
LDHERQVLGRLVLDQPAPGQPALVERLLDPRPLVPQLFDRLVREVAEPVLQDELIDQRAVLIAR